MVDNVGHYTGQNGDNYFQQRRKCRLPIAQKESAKIFQPYVHADDTLVDFGCGTGGIISNIECSRRLGVEISESAQKHATENGVEVYSDVLSLPDKIADVIITQHALEHVVNPYDTLVKLRKKLKENGRVVVVVPAEEPCTKQNRKWKPNEPQHLFSWTPLTLGNLLEVAGYKVDNSFIHSGGYSHYIEWSRRIPVVFEMLKKIVAYTLSRKHTVCVAHIEQI